MKTLIRIFFDIQYQFGHFHTFTAILILSRHYLTGYQEIKQSLTFKLPPV